MKRIAILGSTGSIGAQVLDVVRRLPGRFEVVGLAANANTALLAQQADEFRVPCVCIGSGEPALKSELRGHSRNPELLLGVEGMCEMAASRGADMVVVAVAGAIGIAPTQAALRAGTDVALASKEVLVAAGGSTMRLADASGASILPIDSEHSAIFQCIQGEPEGSIERITLTASGGPFRRTPANRMEEITPEQALKHPTWNMGGLVTINSATLMNKALEIIEAQWLFRVSPDCVDVVVHPQSIVHSMVRFADGSTKAQLGPPDMRLPIQYALVYPERPNTELPRLSWDGACTLEFEPPDEQRFPALSVARRAIAAGGTMPAVMNAANEYAVAAFLNRKLSFPGIVRAVERVIERHSPIEATVENILAADSWARREVAAGCGMM